MVRPRGFEPLAYSFGGCRSIQLSYGRMMGLNYQAGFQYINLAFFVFLCAFSVLCVSRFWFFT
jgi:hypothetical protein